MKNGDMPAMKMSEIVTAIAEVNSQIESAAKTHEENLKNLNMRLVQLRERLNYSKASLDQEKVRSGLSVVSITGRLSSQVRRDAVGDAINALASGGNVLKKRFIGVKNYSSFGDQRCDCEYGFGPKHGHIVFKVGLTTDCRQVITGDQVEAAIYVLLNIDEVLKAEELAKDGEAAV